MKTKMIRWPLLVLVVCLAAFPANSTTLVRMSVAQMTRAAQLVVRARCLANSTARARGSS